MRFYQVVYLVGMVCVIFCIAINFRLYRLPISVERLRLQKRLCDVGLIASAVMLGALLFRLWQLA